MATLRNHNGIKTLYLTPRQHRYAVCTDGKILFNGGAGWKLAQPRITVDLLSNNFTEDTSAQAQAIITRANRDAEAHERAKRIRRSRRF